ncbi:MAG: hypothetical protein CL672_08530 [Balneola sp.]|nr:hypothetical protein [Balneola sp.]|tara:strand:+ start:5740 stop:6093 length:354 start_codon:yes stop_codon:yes gene_type:complete
MKLYISLIAVTVILSFTTKIDAQDFYIHENGVTIVCDNAEVGESGIIDGTTYTKRTKDQITIENASTTCTSGIIDMNALFRDATTFNGVIGHWDVSKVTDMNKMFNTATRFNQDISA